MPIKPTYISRKVILLTILVGVVSGFGSILFYSLLNLFTELLLGLSGYKIPTPAGEKPLIELDLHMPYNPYLLILIPAIGGLISGLIVYTFAPETEGDGTDAVIGVFHNKRGIIRGRVPIIKTIASAITIGSGGSAGREGPISQIGAGFASFISMKLNLSEKEREILVLCGMAGGISSIFKSPFGGSLFGIEVLYHRDYETEAFIPVIISSFIAYATFALFTGWNAIFETPHYIFSPFELPFFAILGIITGAVSRLYVVTFYGIRDKFFRKLRIYNHLKPMIGGFLVGLIGFFIPESLAAGYGLVQIALYNKLTLEIMFILIIAKIITTSLTITSGGSGGVFAPSLVIGAMIGGVFGLVSEIFFPDIIVDPAVFVLIGMISFFAGSAKVPLAAIIMVSEMTGNYNLLMPAFLAASMSYFISGELSIYEQQLMTKLESPIHLPEHIYSLLGSIKVREAACPDVTIVYGDMNLTELEKIISEKKHLSLPVASREGKYIGIVSLFDLLSIDPKEWSRKHVNEITKCKFAYVYPDDSILKALSLMLTLNIPRLPVLDKEKNKIIGEVSYDDLAKLLYHKARSIT